MKVSAPGKTTLYSYDNNGNRANQAETYTSAQPSGYIDASTSKEIQYMLKKSIYTYSNAEQLLKLVEVLYDENSREIARKTTKYIYDSNGNQLKQSTSCTLTDNTQLRPVTNGTAYGEGITDSISAQIEKVSYTYDGFNRLVSAETIKSGKRTIAKYLYNGDDLRESKTVTEGDKTEQTYYTYDRQHVILETDAAGNQKASYIKGINYIAKADSKGNTAFYLYNGHGDVVQVVDSTGEIINQYDYDIWGNPTLTIETAANAIRYAGEFMDSETGMYYLRARYYDPYTGRFVSEDSYWGEDENPLSLNLYTYCSNDPVNFTDPTGHLQKGDEKLTMEAQAQIVDLTNKYFSATTQKDKDKIHELAQAIRNNPTNVATEADAKSNEKVNEDFYGGFNKSTVATGSINASQWSSISGSFGVAGALNFDSNLNMNSLRVQTDYHATINNKGNIGIITSSGKSNVTIDNSGNIGSFISTSSGTNVINNAGVFTTVSTGKNSSTFIENSGKMKDFYTGDNSFNYVNDLTKVLKIYTGEGNTTITNVSDVSGKGNYIALIVTKEYRKNPVTGEEFVVITDNSQEIIINNLIALGYTNAKTNYFDALYKFLAEYTDNGHSLKADLDRLASEAKEPALMRWTSLALKKNSSVKKTETRYPNEKEYTEISKSWKDKHGGNYTTLDEIKAVIAVYLAGFREKDFPSYSDYEKAVFEANAQIAETKYSIKPEEFLMIMLGVFAKNNINLKGNYETTKSGGVIYTEGTLKTIQVPGSVQSRINISNSGWSHILKEHFSGKNKSQFTITKDKLKSLLQSKDIIKTPVTRTLDSADGTRYVREIDVGYNIGTDKFNNFQPTSTMTVLTDKYGNLITATPGVIN